jgi:hypothetical protein
MPQRFAKTVRDAMHGGCECIDEGQSLLDAAPGGRPGRRIVPDAVPSGCPPETR